MLRSARQSRLSRTFAGLAFAAGIAVLSACSAPVTRSDQHDPAHREFQAAVAGGVRGLLQYAHGMLRGGSGHSVRRRHLTDCDLTPTRP